MRLSKLSVLHVEKTKNDEGSWRKLSVNLRSVGKKLLSLRRNLKQLSRVADPDDYINGDGSPQCGGGIKTLS